MVGDRGLGDSLIEKTDLPFAKKKKEHFMKVLALNSSPRGEGQSKTGLLLNHLVEGMREAGAEVEVIDLRKKTIRFCAGCFTCWTKTPGLCIHQDDMTRELFPKWLASDLVIYASPLYHYTINASMKAFIERTLPVLQPFFERNEGKTRHPLRQKTPKAVFLSVAGFPERAVFDQLSSWVRFVFGRDENLLAEIYQPAAESLTHLGEKTEEPFAALRQAGKEIVNQLAVSPETMSRISQEIVEEKEAFANMGNLFWKTCIAEGVTPREFDEKGLMPRPDSIETFLEIMHLGFSKEAASDLKAIMQFYFSGEVEGPCYFRIENGCISPGVGEAENPDLTIESPFELWMDILTGKADGQQMLMEEKYKVTGDLSLLMQMGQLFGKSQS
jgi:multimeric flavodoxin WrbA/putative sterol carrier protein